MDAPWTKGPYRWARFAHDDEDLERMRQVGIDPVRMLTNEGQVAVMAGTERVALVDCQTPFKRGAGYKAECAIRDATASLFAAAPDLADQHDSNLVDLDFLRRAIVEGDPSAELLIRVDDLIRRSREALSKALPTPSKD